MEEEVVTEKVPVDGATREKEEVGTEIRVAAVIGTET